MIIKQIRLTNFRQYRNERIDFATNPEKNVTVILGENTHGKTTLVCAFIWCLYREFGLKGQLFSSATADEMSLGEEGITEVMMTLEHNDIEYRVTTKQIFKKTANGMSPSSKASTNLIKNGKSIPDPTLVNHEIQNILKQDVKDYFFYDGENNRIEQVGKKTSIKSAIYQMMGIDMVIDVAKYFNPSSANLVAYRLNQDLEVDPTPELQMYKKKLENSESERHKKEVEVCEKLKEIDTLELQKNEKEKILDEYPDIEPLQIRKKKLENDIKTDMEKVDTYFYNLITSFNGKQSSNLQDILFSKIFKKFEINTFSEKSSFNKEDSLSYINEKVIDQLIERKRCICGAIITDSNDARMHLEEAREHMEPHDYAKYLGDFCKRMNSYVEYEEKCKDRIKTSADIFLTLVENIEKNKVEKADISESIEGKPDIGKIQKDINVINEQIIRLETTIDILEKETLPKLDEQILDANENIQRLAKKNCNNELIDKCIDYMKVVYNTANTTIKKKKNEIRVELEKQVNVIFSSVYHGERVVKIDEEFNINTELKNGEKLSASGGTESVKNFSFVTGLIKLAKKHILSEGSSYFTHKEDDKYPLVMDAPFSGVDSEHIKNVCRILPEYCDQVIIVLLNNAYRDAEDTLKDKVGKVYKLNKISEKCSEIKEVN